MRLPAIAAIGPLRALRPLHLRGPRASFFPALAFAFGLAACGGHSGGGAADPGSAASPGVTLSGAAAVGAPITGGTLRIVDADGLVVAAGVPLAADGSYAGIALSGRAPWRLEACGHAGPNWTCVQSVAQQGSGNEVTAHVTPLTSALVLLASGSAPDALMNGAAPGLDAAALATAQAALRSGLAPVLASAGVDAGLDLVSGPLAAGSRTGYDRLLDAVQVNTGVDGQAFVQIGSRLGSGNLYLEQGAPALGALSADAGAGALPLAGLETLFARMSAAIASAEACAHADTGLASTLAADAQMSLGGPPLQGAAQVAQGLCAFLGGGSDGDAVEPARWGSRFMSPVLGRCDFSGAAPVCGISFALQDSEGGVESLGGGMAVSHANGQWRFKGDRLALPMHASARVQRDLRIDSATAVPLYNRALAFDIPAAAGLACARISQRNAAGQLVTFAYFKNHGGGSERLSLWTAGGQSNERSLDPLAGSTRSGDDTWVMLPQGDDGDAAVRHFFRGGRSVLVDLYADAACSTDHAVGGHSRFELDVDGVPPVWSALPTLPWPELNAASQTALRAFSVAADTAATLDAGWTFARGSMAVGEVTVCSERASCGEGGLGRIGQARARPSARGVAVDLRSVYALAAADNKALLLSGRNGEGLALQSTFLSCPRTPAGQACRDGDVQVQKPTNEPRKRR